MCVVAMAIVTVVPSRPRPSVDAAVSAPAGFDPAAVDRFVRSELHWSRVPGGAVVIVEGERVVYARGFGSGVTAHTRFRLGSSSKSFTALAIMQLVDGGRLTLDDPVQRLLPWFRVADGLDSSRITIRELLTHTSGLSHADGLRALGGDGSESTESLVRSLKSARLSHHPGSHFEYSNSNYEVLGLIVEAASGQPYEEYMASHVFAPLGMSDTSVGPDGARAQGYHSWFGLPVRTASPYLRAAVPAGFVTTTAADLGRYLTAQLNDGAVDGRAIVSPTAMATLHTPAVSAGQSGGGGQQYAMGWYVGPLGGEHAIWHHGNAFVSGSTLAVLRDHHAAVGVLTDEPMTFNLPSDRIARGITHILRGHHPDRPGWAANRLVFVIDTVFFLFTVLIAEVVLALRVGRAVLHTVVGAGAAAVAIIVLGALRHGLGSVSFAWRELPDATLILGAGSLVLLIAAAAHLVLAIARSVAGRRPGGGRAAV